MTTQTIILVKAALSGQKDKQGVSKFEHCLRVASNVDMLCLTNYRHLFTTDDEIKKAYRVGLLHDVIEDSDLTAFDLRSLGWISEEEIVAVELLTHDNDECSYNDYIEKLCRSGNKYALIGKLGDNLDNNSESRLEGLEESFKNYLTKRYSGVKEKLIKALENL